MDKIEKRRKKRSKNGKTGRGNERERTSFHSDLQNGSAGHLFGDQGEEQFTMVGSSSVML